MRSAPLVCLFLTLWVGQTAAEENERPRAHSLPLQQLSSTVTRPQRLSWDYHCPSNNGLYSKDIDKEACRSPVLFFSCIGKFTFTFETRSFRGTVFSLGFPISFDIRCIRSVLITYLYMFNIAMTRLIVILVKVLHSYEKYSDLLSAEHYV